MFRPWSSKPLSENVKIRIKSIVQLIIIFVNKLLTSRLAIILPSKVKFDVCCKNSNESFAVVYSLIVMTAPGFC